MRIPAELHDDEPIDFQGMVMPAGAARNAARELLEETHRSFAKLRDDWITYRSTQGVEFRWRKSMALFEGDADPVVSPFVDVLQNGPKAPKTAPADSPRSKVTVNIVRPKVEAAVARMCEILLPTDAANWGLRPTPLPEAMSTRMADRRQTVDPQTGQPTGVTAADEVQAIIDDATERARNMQRLIEDQLTECDYNGKQRKGIEDGVKLGTMVMLGPIPAKQSSKVWMPMGNGQAAMIIKETTVPSSEIVDPWDIWFDPSCGNDHQKGRGYIRLRRVNRTGLRKLVGVPGYDAKAIARILSAPPTWTKVVNGRVIRDTGRNEIYELWEYHGEIDPQDFQVLREGMEQDDEVELDTEFACLLMVGDEVIGALPSWVPDRTLPVDVWCWREADDSPYGHSLCEELESQQRVVNACWRMIMDNGRTSGGSQILMLDGVRPANGSRVIDAGVKLWSAPPDLDDARKAMVSVDFPSRLQELLAILDKAQQYADTESSMPQLMNGQPGTQGNTGAAAETLGGMVMRYNNANTGLRYRVKRFDDRVTRPHIGRYYDYNMSTSEDPSVKGDAEVDAVGASALVERDIANQSAMQLSALSQNPRYSALLKPREELKAILRGLKHDAATLMVSETEQAEAEKNAQQGQPDPRIAVAEMNMQAKQMDIADRQEQRLLEAKLSEAELQLKRELNAYNIERERAQGEQQTRAQNQEAELALVKMEQDGIEQEQERRSKEALEKMKLESKHQLFNAESALRVRTGQGI